LEVEWGPASIYTPPDGWYHQHMCTSKEPARHIALYGGRVGTPNEDPILLVPTREGGTLIDYEDEDPEIRRRFQEALKKEGVECQMPPVVYR
jgi:hypothetical protein